MADGGHLWGSDPRGGRVMDVSDILRGGQHFERPRVVITGDDGTVVPLAVSAFGLPLSQEEFPIPNLQLSFPYNVNDRIVASVTANGGTVTQSASKAVLQTSNNAAGSAQIQSRSAARYTPGQGIVWRGTGVFSAGAVNSRQEIGIGDLQDGFFFGFVEAGTFAIIVRAGGGEGVIPQSVWNGTVPTFDPTLGNVYQIRFQWLGFGAIRFFIEDPATGYPVLVHTIFYANTATGTSIRNPTLPCHARVLNSGNAANVTLQTPSMGVFCEGPFNSYGVSWSTGNRKTGVTTETSVFTVRNDVTVFGGAAGNNRVRVHINSVGSGVSNAQDARVRMVLNATLGGVPAFTALDAARSVVSIDVAGTTVAGGFEIRRWPQAANTSIVEEISGMEFRLNPGDTLTMAATGVTGSINADLSLGWHEEI